jgi:hypothetical protein
LQLDLMQALPILLLFSLVFVVIVMAVTGWPKMLAGTLWSKRIRTVHDSRSMGVLVSFP